MKSITENTKLPPVFIIKLLTAFRNWIYRIHAALAPANVVVFEKAQRFWISKALGVACELNLADIIGEGECTIEYLARETNTHQQSLYRLMRTLASDGIFCERESGLFVNTSLSNALAESGGSMKYMIQHHLNNTNWDIVNEMGYSVKTGNCSASKVLGMDIFDHLRKFPEKNALYNKAMSNTSAISGGAIVSAYNFKGISLLADIGGGEGHLLAVILSRFPGMKGILLDFPHVALPAESTFEKFGVAERADVVQGDFFETIPEGADAYLMKNILHAFDDNSCKLILDKIRAAMNPTAKLLIVEAVIGHDNKPSFGKILDMQMMTGTKSGRERTRDEFETMLRNAGFRLNRVVETASPFSIVEAVLPGNE